MSKRKQVRNVHNVRNVLGVAVAALLSCMPLSGMAQTAPTAAQWTAIQAAGNKEGKVSLYHNLNPAGAELLANDFRKEIPGIRLEMTRLGSAPLIERFRTEFTSNRHIADVVITFPDDTLFEGMKTGWMAAWVPPELRAYPAKVNYQKKNMLFNIQTAREAIIWNTQRVRGNDAPKEWSDLFEPRFKDRVGMNPPWRSVAIQGIIAYWEKLNLGDTATKLKNNNVRFFEGSGGIIQAVIRGDVHVAELTDLPLNPALADGAPIGFVYPQSGTTLSEGYMFVANKAPNPNAAKVFSNWIMTGRGQLLLQTYAGLSASRPGLPPLTHLPATEKLSRTVDGLSLTPPAKQKQIVDHWRKVFGVQ